MAFKKAVREQVWLKILLSGPSGCGKSYSALKMATGLAKKCGSQIAMIGTESSRDLYYANEFNYDLLQLDQPYTVDKYINAIDEAIDGGYKVLIIDSTTQEWQWINDQHDKMPGNSFQNWGKIKPLHNKFMEKVLFSPIHVIATARGRDEWVLEEDSKGKKVPKKVGLGTNQSKDIEYEYTVSLMIDQDTHTACPSKDNTHLFENNLHVITEKDGEALYDWANDSEVKPTLKKPASFETATEDLGAIHKEIVQIATELGGTKNAEMMALLKTYSKNGNPNNIKDPAQAKECLNKMREMKDKANK